MEQSRLAGRCLIRVTELNRRDLQRDRSPLEREREGKRKREI